MVVVQVQGPQVPLQDPVMGQDLLQELLAQVTEPDHPDQELIRAQQVQEHPDRVMEQVREQALVRDPNMEQVAVQAQTPGQCLNQAGANARALQLVRDMDPVVDLALAVITEQNLQNPEAAMEPAVLIAKAKRVDIQKNTLNHLLTLLQ